MISIDVFYEGVTPIKIATEGHAGVKNQDGYEVCVATSALMQAMVLSLEKAAKGIVKHKKAKGFFELVLVGYKDGKKNKNDIYLYCIIANAYIESIKALALENGKYIDYKEHYNGE